MNDFIKYTPIKKNETPEEQKARLTASWTAYTARVQTSPSASLENWLATETAYENDCIEWLELNTRISPNYTYEQMLADQTRIWEIEKLYESDGEPFNVGDIGRFSAAIHVRRYIPEILGEATEQCAGEWHRMDEIRTIVQNRIAYWKAIEDDYTRTLNYSRECDRYGYYEKYWQDIEEEEYFWREYDFVA
jgi:hypothetical protein